MVRPLADKVALVTGSTSGIGLGLATGLAKAGAHIVLNGFGDMSKIERARSTFETELGIRALYSAADMRDPDAIMQMMAYTEKTLGSIDILINNAGIQYVAPVESFPIEKWNAILAINLTSAFHTIRASLPGMRRNGFGRIINIASAHGLVASPYKSAYIAAKHGIVGLTKTIGLETAQDENITCNAICPGYVRTPLVENQIKEQAQAHKMSEEDVIHDVILAAQPNKRFVGIEELTDLLLYLCSDSAKSFNGAALPIDGGWTAR